MKTFTVDVIQTVKVTVDETKFDADFFKEFNKHFYQFGTSLEKHAEHLGQLYARGVESEFSTFIEGYGIPQAMGIVLSELDFETTVTKGLTVYPDNKRPLPTKEKS